MTLLFRPPRPARHVPRVRRPIAYAMDTGPNGPIAELREPHPRARTWPWSSMKTTRTPARS